METSGQFKTKPLEAGGLRAEQKLPAPIAEPKVGVARLGRPNRLAGWALCCALAAAGYSLMHHGNVAEKGAPERTSTATAKNREAIHLLPSDLNHGLTSAAQLAAQRGETVPGFRGIEVLLPRIQAGDVRFFSLIVYDNCDEDGDVVIVNAGHGVSFGPIRLTNAGTVLNIPVLGNETPHVEVVAIKDGSDLDMVTVGVRSLSGSVWLSSVMRPGAREIVPVSLR
jgi:hypothetical protein